MDTSAIVHLSRDQLFSADHPPVVLNMRDCDNNQSSMHDHDFYELVFVRSGSGEHWTENGSYQIWPGDVFLIKPGAYHAYKEMKKLCIANFLFLPELLEQHLFDLKDTVGYYSFFLADPQLHDKSRFKSRLALDDAQIRQVEEWLLIIKQAQMVRAPGWKFQITMAFLQILGLVCIAFSREESQRSAEMIMVGRTLRYYANHYTESITLADIATELGKSLSSFVHTFKAATGKSPIQYLIEFRLKKAAELLRSTDRKITDIALSTGFSDGNYFIKMFSRRFGMPPRAYRRVAAGR